MRYHQCPSAQDIHATQQAHEEADRVENAGPWVSACAQEVVQKVGRLAWMGLALLCQQVFRPCFRHTYRGGDTYASQEATSAAARALLLWDPWPSSSPPQHPSSSTPFPLRAKPYQAVKDVSRCP